jgi:thiamine-phosphate diphosphorylase
LGANRLLGVSVHSVSDAARAAEGGADYLFVGTLFETASHPKAVVRGAEFVGEVAAHVEIPLVGIGGVTPERTIDVLASGGHGVAVMRGIWNAPSPSDAVHAYLDAIEQAIREKRVTLHE